MIVLLRHAHAGSRDAWEGEEGTRPLSDRGRLQARLLAERLGRHAIDRILSSPAVRCVQTVVPFSESAGLGIETLPTLGEGGDVGELAAVVDRSGDGLLICSHGDVLIGLAHRLAAAGAPLDPDLPIAKGGAWWLETRHGSIAAATYSPPPA